MIRACLRLHSVQQSRRQPSPEQLFGKKNARIINDDRGVNDRYFFFFPRSILWFAKVLKTPPKAKSETAAPSPHGSVTGSTGQRRPRTGERRNTGQQHHRKKFPRHDAGPEPWDRERRSVQNKILFILHRLGTVARVCSVRDGGNAGMTAAAVMDQSERLKKK